MGFRIPVFLLVVSMLVFAGCHKKKTISGEEFISADVLVDMLVDIHLVDGITNDPQFHRRYEGDSIDLLSPILDKYSLTREMFDTTMAMYSRYPELLDQVYSEVLIKLNVMLDEIDKEEKVEISKPEE